MATNLKRFTISVLPGKETELDLVKKVHYYRGGEYESDKNRYKG